MPAMAGHQALVRVLLLIIPILLVGHQTMGQPAVEITSPAPNAVIPSDGSYSVQVTGSASADTHHVSLTLITGDGAFPGIAVSGTTSWSQILQAITPGTNTIEAVAVDDTGLQSVVAKRTFNYVVKSPIVLSTNGHGGIKPGFNTSGPLVVGNSYSLTAIAQPNSIFQSWTLATPDDDGVPDVETAPALSFTMLNGLSVSATFITNPYPAMAAAYNEVLRDGSGRPVGLVGFTISKTGAAAGAVQLGGSTYRFSGPLNGLGFLNTTLATGAINFSVQAGLGAGNRHLVASLADTNAMVLGTASMPEGGAPDLAGTYALVFPPDSTQAGSPQGNGFASLTVTSQGAARLMGYLADGTQFATAGTVSANSTIPVYVFLKQGNGYLAGDLLMQPTVSQGVGGTLAWATESFTASLDTQGSMFRAPSRTRSILGLSGGSPNGKFIALGADLSGEQQDLITVQPAGVVIPANHADQLVVTINKSNGSFQGSFVPTGEAGVVRFRGALLQQQGFGAGYFIHNGLTGQVFIEGN